jgi:hypothetical protein
MARSRSIAQHSRGHWRGRRRSVWQRLPRHGPPAGHADTSRATAQPTSAEGRDPDGVPQRQSNRARQYRRYQIRQASSAIVWLMNRPTASTIV